MLYLYFNQKFLKTCSYFTFYTYLTSTSKQVQTEEAAYAYLTVPVFSISQFSDSLEEDIWEQHYQNRKQ